MVLSPGNISAVFFLSLALIDLLLFERLELVRVFSRPCFCVTRPLFGLHPLCWSRCYPLPQQMLLSIDVSPSDLSPPAQCMATAAAKYRGFCGQISCSLFAASKHYGRHLGYFAAFKQRHEVVLELQWFHEQQDLCFTPTDVPQPMESATPTDVYGYGWPQRSKDFWGQISCCF